jgi:hypothetical protein
MKLKAPKMYTWVAAVVIAALGLLGHFVNSIPFVSPHNFWFVGLGMAVLVLGTVIEQL